LNKLFFGGRYFYEKAKAIFSLVVALMVLAIFCFAQNTGSTATTAAAAVDSNNDDWLHCKGNKIYDMYGNEVWLTGANWFGFNCSETVSTVPGMMLKPF